MSFRFAVSATFTAEPIARVLEFWGGQLQSPFEVRFAPYNQLVQSLTGEFAGNQHGVNVLLVRLEDLGQFDSANGDALGRIESNLQDVVRLIRDAPQYTSVPLILVLCPPSPRFTSSPSRGRFAHEMNLRTKAMLEGTPGVLYLGYEEIQRLYPVDDPANPEGERLGRIPYTDLYFCALGTAIVRMAHGLGQPPFKVIALDCDNTLWKGICGEDGPRGIVLDEPCRRLQEFMVEQREDGMLLALASKNNEQDVLDTFAQNPEMPLQFRHFVAGRLNWQSKYANLVSLADELSVGLDSFIFVDDSPKECAEVEDGAPEVLALALPAQEADIPLFLEHVWAFDHVMVTEEDRHRNAYYAQSQDFGRELKGAQSLQDFFAKLNLEVRCAPFSADRVSRIAQLTQRTNQFNLTTIRRTEAEILALANDSAKECLTVDVSDRFGDYGLTGVLIFAVNAGALEIDTLLLSCRVLGRGVEYRVIAYLGAEALRRGLDTVIARLRPTSRNEPARQFLERIDAKHQSGQGGDLVYRLPAAKLIELTWQPTLVEAAPPVSAGKRNTTQKRPDYARIATEFSTPAQILEALRRQSAEARENQPGEDMTQTEARLAEIWSDLLRRPDVSLASNFFDLGGHSLLVVLLLVRVREAFGVELAMDDVYAPDLTLRDLARRIEMLQLGDPGEYEALLKEVENMSDEEVARLLAEEDSGLSRS